MLDRLIHEPARLRLVTLLYVVDEADFVYLATQTGLTDGNISSHMAKLEGAGYVEIDKRFVDRKPRTLYRLTPAGRSAVDQYRAEIGDLLEGLDGK
jgi:DNA-binding MarR family transcriptional regulator